MYKLCYYVPPSRLELTRQALFDAGAGRIGDYDQCCWQVLGEGQFRPMAGSRPFLGRSGEIECVEEYRVEMVCAAEYIVLAIAALKQAHPYEELAYDVVSPADL